VIDDECGFRGDIKKDLGESVDCVNVKWKKEGDLLATKISKEESLTNIDNALKGVAYAAILMDGKLGLNLGEEQDGTILSQRLRSGFYGELNQNTLIFNISSGFDNPYSKGSINKYHYNIEVLEKLLV
jgi:hypothetical protein